LVRNLLYFRAEHLLSTKRFGQLGAALIALGDSQAKQSF